MSSTAEPVGTIDVALAHASRLLQSAPELAVEQASEILRVAPDHPRARLIIGAAHRIVGRLHAALDVLEALAREYPQSWPVHLELGIALGESGRSVEAVAALLRVVRLKPDSVDGWRLLADQLDATGEASDADLARARYLKAATQDPRLMEAAAALVANDLPLAEARLRHHLQAYPTDIAALRMLAEVAGRLRRYADAQSILEECLRLSPSFDAARHNYAAVLNRQGKAAEALPHVERLLAREPRNPSYRNLQAAVLVNVGDYAQSIQIYEAVLRELPHQPKIWMSYGHSLRTAGRQEESIAAYRRAIALEPTLGEAWWSLANLKTFRFAPEEIGAMEEALAQDRLCDEDRLHFEFALGKALEDQEQYESSFSHYSRGNSLRAQSHPYSAEENSGYIRRSKALFTGEFFDTRAGRGLPAEDPIFIVGLPRAGSTLVEQILASHSLVEGTMELPNIPQIARELMGARDGDSPTGFLQTLASLPSAELRSLGQRYLDGTRVMRKAGKPFFIDKMPNNFLYVGLIHLILPNARIIDVRRHPLACCFSCFKQHFARGQSFTYDLRDLGRYYHDYVELMAHFDGVLPNRIHRVFYERLIGDTQTEVRRLLAYCGLPFEARCLEFYNNERAVRTASSEQVRQPIYREAIDHWRHYEPWLDPLTSALGPVLSAYPGVPVSF